MIKKHREQRTSIKADRENKKGHHKDKIAEKSETQGNNHNHGLKRSGSQSWQGDSHKVSKHKHQSAAQNDGLEVLNTTGTFYKPQNVANTPGVTNFNEPTTMQQSTVS